MIETPKTIMPNDLLRQCVEYLFQIWCFEPDDLPAAVREGSRQ